MEPNTGSKKIVSVVIGAIVVAGVAAASFLGAKKVPVQEQPTKEGENNGLEENGGYINPSVTGGTSASLEKLNPTSLDDEEMDDDDAPVSATPAPTMPAGTAFKDGSYTATGTYMSPGGSDSLSVTLSIKNGVVTDSSVTVNPGDSTSARFMTIFADNYKPYVVGQNLSTLSLTKVSRSSLTPIGFNDAVSKIRVQAKM